MVEEEQFRYNTDCYQWPKNKNPRTAGWHYGNLKENSICNCLGSLGRHFIAVTLFSLGLDSPMYFQRGSRRPLNRRLHKHLCGATHSLHLPVLLFSCFYVGHRTGTGCTQVSTHTLKLFFPSKPTFVLEPVVFLICTDELKYESARHSLTNQGTCAIWCEFDNKEFDNSSDGETSKHAPPCLPLPQVKAKYTKHLRGHRDSSRPVSECSLVSSDRELYLAVDSTQEADISMPGIPALCSLCRGKQGCPTLRLPIPAQHLHDINVLHLQCAAPQPHECMLITRCKHFTLTPASRNWQTVETLQPC